MENPQIFADLPLAQRLEGAEGMAAMKFVKARMQFAPEVGATWMECGGAYALYDGPTSPVTQTFGLGMFEQVKAEVLDELERFFRERRAPVLHEVSPLAGTAVAEMLHTRGYRPLEFTSVLYRALRASQATPIGDGITVRTVQGRDAEQWAEVNARGWAAEQPELFEFLRNFGALNIGRDDFICFLAEHEGTPAAAGSLSISAGVAMLAGAATIPGKRKLGLQQALLATRVEYAKAAGCDLAMMGALPGGSSQRNAERHGFRIAYTRIKWENAKGVGE